MPAATERLEFAPPKQPGAIRSFVLAVLAHLVLLAALTWGVQWRRQSQDIAAEAELWSSVPQQAAPKEVAPPPPPPQPQPVVKEQPKPEPQPNRDAEIALEREKQKKIAEDKRRHEEELQRKEEARKLAQEQKARELADKKRKQAAEEKERERRHQETVAKMQAMAGATGGPTDKGSALRSTGLSSAYAGRLAAIFRRNMRFPGGVDSIPGNPRTEVIVRVSAGGTILSVRAVRPSGNASWDDAVLRAIEATERIPADENGRYPTEFPLGWGPKD